MSAALAMNAVATRDMVGFNKNDVALAVLPLFHSFGQTVIMNTAFTSGATITLLPRFTPDAALGIMQRDNVTIFDGMRASSLKRLADCASQGTTVAARRESPTWMTIAAAPS